MKGLLLLSLLFNVNVLFSQATAIPDSNFEQALVDLNIDSDGMNGGILNADAEQFMGILDVSNKNISDLTGIESFLYIPELNCSYNDLTTLDLSSNTFLVAISANNNNLTNINLNNLSELTVLNLHNNQLDSLDFSAHNDLYYLMCYTNNLQYLNVESNSNLAFLSCGENQLTGNLDISNLFDLQFFSCRYNQISAITTWFHPDMTIFNCQNNSLWEIDLSNCSSLEQVYLDSNQFTAVNVKNSTNFLINDFHAEGNPNLYCIQVDDYLSSANDPNWIENVLTSYSDNCYWVDLSELENSNYKVFPNPASDWLQIEMPHSEEKQFQLFDLNGIIQFSGTISKMSNEIDIRSLSSGVYLIKIDEHIERFLKF